MKKVLFIDRDNTIIVEPPDEQVDSFDKLGFIPGVISALSKISAETDYELVMATNQDGLGTSIFPEEIFWPVHNKMLQILKGEGIVFSEIFIDKTLPAENSPTRKPGTALLTKYLSHGIDLESSFVIGDRLSDIEFAENIGCKAILLNKQNNPKAQICTTDWNEIYRYLKCVPRAARIARNTAETRITIEINLDGSGKETISTGIGFFDHLLKQIARHGNVDLVINAQGDLESDEHHLIEDVAIVLGETFLKASGGKKGIERYGFILPMDESLAQVTLDFGGRPWLEWDVIFVREKIGEMPTEMFFHFFKSFSDSAKCNLNIKAKGTNEHHKIEAIFKAFARAIKMALKQTDNYSLPTTKGAL
jgi:imidazoleglycerol-phosphate dehydratase / histidinol-phosphatase